MRIESRILALVAAGVAVVMAPNVRAGAQLELISGSSDIIIPDNGPGDFSSAQGQVVWMGTINGWNFTVNVGDTKPILGSATSPQLDLSVTANTPGNGNLIVMFSDDGFGPTSGTVNSTFFQNGTSTATSDVLINGVSSTDANLQGPYSITLVDTFTPGTISSDHRVSVPDGGATVALLGFGLVGVEAIRRRFVKKA